LSTCKCDSRRIFLRSRLFAALLLALGARQVAQAQPAAKAPQFTDYAVRDIFRGRAAKVDLGSPENRNYRTRLKEAAAQKANFAGHYVVTTWGCGTSCANGAAVDLTSGKVTFLPATICCWGDVDKDFKPAQFEARSRLIIFHGQLNEEGPAGPHYFQLEDGAFKRLSEAR
jgi:hypothetical protein